MSVRYCFTCLYILKTSHHRLYWTQLGTPKDLVESDFGVAKQGGRGVRRGTTLSPKWSLLGSHWAAVASYTSFLCYLPDTIHTGYQLRNRKKTKHFDDFLLKPCLFRCSSFSSQDLPFLRPFVRSWSKPFWLTWVVWPATRSVRPSCASCCSSS